MTHTTVVELDVRGPFSLAESRAFLRGFTPASGASADVDEDLALALRLDGTFAPVGVVVRQRGSRVTCELAAPPPSSSATRATAEAAAHQVARMLALDVDATAWGDIGRKDRVLGGLLAQHAGFRPVAFASPWEAGVWGLLVHRINMKQAAVLKRRVAEVHGDVVTIGSGAGATVIPIFPSPAQVLALPDAPAGVPVEKWQRIAGLARAALAGDLDADKLRAMSLDDAMAHLAKLRGVGPWTAAHVYLRGAATVDAIALHEPRVVRAVQNAYGSSAPPTDEELRKLSERWRPFRTWAMILLALHLNRTGQWHDENDGAERAKRVARAKKRPAARTTTTRANAARRAPRT